MISVTIKDVSMQKSESLLVTIGDLNTNLNGTEQASMLINSFMARFNLTHCDVALDGERTTDQFTYWNEALGHFL